MSCPEIGALRPLRQSPLARFRHTHTETPSRGSLPRQQGKDGIVKANDKLTIDRTDWGIRYRSGKFYDNLADQAVSDEVEIQMKIVAKNK